ncbi:MAG: single-stranded DNA-binding protein [Bacteroidota bacterium]|jgi:single-strand binding protein|nr:single-strand binding protein [Bacteroidetes oral taxon 274 str. F0058]
MALNKVFLIGNAGKDPEVHYFDSNTRKATFSLATTDRGFTRADGTVVPERTEWHNIVAWRGLAEIIEKYVRKGTKLFVEGKLTSRSYEDKSGVKRYVTEIVAENLELLSRANSSQDEAPPAAGNAPTQPQYDYVPPTDTNEDSDLPF